MITYINTKSPIQYLQPRSTYDKALIGIGTREGSSGAVDFPTYDYGKLLDIFKNEHLHEEDRHAAAIEWFESTIKGAQSGEGAPQFLEVSWRDETLFCNTAASFTHGIDKLRADRASNVTRN